MSGVWRRSTVGPVRHRQPKGAANGYARPTPPRQTSTLPQAREEKEFTDVKSVHLTAAGSYYLDRLSGEFQYCARVIPDTFIVDEMVYSQLYDLYRPAVSRNFLLSLDKQLQATELFVRYLDAQEQAEHETGAIARSPVLGERWFGDRCVRQVLAEIERIRRVLAAIAQGKVEA
jgi:hypothetical protein